MHKECMMHQAGLRFQLVSSRALSCLKKSKTAEHELAKMEIRIVCDFHLSQSKQSTSQCSGRRLTWCRRCRKHKIEFPISNSIFNPPVSRNDQTYLCMIIVLNDIQIFVKNQIQLWRNDFFDLKWLSIYDI